jgi:hypothetical protein
VIGLSGLIAAYVSPSAVDAIFGLGAIPLAFVPIILGRIWTTQQSVWPVMVVLLWGVVMGFAIIIIGGEFRNIGPIILFLGALFAYPILEFLARKFGGKQ